MHIVNVVKYRIIAHTYAGIQANTILTQLNQSINQS